MKLIMSIRETFYKRKAGVELRDLTKSRLSWKQKSVRLPDSQILSGARKKSMGPGNYSGPLWSSDVNPSWGTIPEAYLLCSPQSSAHQHTAHPMDMLSVLVFWWNQLRTSAIWATGLICFIWGTHILICHYLTPPCLSFHICKTR